MLGGQRQTRDRDAAAMGLYARTDENRGRRRVPLMHEHGSWRRRSREPVLSCNLRAPS